MEYDLVEMWADLMDELKEVKKVAQKVVH